MSNPKGQHLKLVFPLAWGTSSFSWAIHTTARVCIYLNTNVYLWEGHGQSPGRAEALWDGCHMPVPDSSPLAHRTYDLNLTLVLQMENWSPCDWLLKIGWGSLWRTELNSCQVKSLGLQTGQPMLSEADSLQNFLLPSRTARLVQAQIMRSLSSSHSHKAWVSVLQYMGWLGCWQTCSECVQELCWCHQHMPQCQQQCRVGERKPRVVSHFFLLLQPLQSLYG